MLGGGLPLPAPGPAAASIGDGVIAITGDSMVHNCDVSRKVSSIPVSTITMYATDSGQFRGKLIAASHRMRAYAIKKQLIRVLDSTGVYRLLLKGHAHPVVDLAVRSRARDG
jgi:hypothetical protein